MGRNGAVARAQNLLQVYETYAGFEGESSLLEELHNGASAARPLARTFMLATAC